MPYAVTHILVPMILIDTIRDRILKLKKQFLPNKYILLAGLAGLFPDIDIPVSIILFGDVSVHRTFGHSIWIPLAFFIGFVYSYLFKKQKWWKFFLMCFIGVSIHIILDASLSGYVSLFYPFSDTPYGLNLLPSSKASLIFTIMDAVSLFGWLIYEKLQHHISDFF